MRFIAHHPISKVSELSVNRSMLSRCTRYQSRLYSLRQQCFSSVRVAYTNRTASAQNPLDRRKYIHRYVDVGGKTDRNPFSTSVLGRSQQPDEEKAEKGSRRKRKVHRGPAGESSLRSVAVEAQRSKEGKHKIGTTVSSNSLDVKTVTAVAAAEQYDIAKASHILQSKGFRLDPYGTNLYPQVIHMEIPIDSPTPITTTSPTEYSDVFVFPSGTVVAWNLSEDALSDFVNQTISPASGGARQIKPEEEDLDYVVDPQRDNSSIKNDCIVLGTKPSFVDSSATVLTNGRDLDTVLAKIAFSSGLARSTKLSVLETLLEHYFETTKEITQRLSQGGRLPSSRSAILQKTGQLLSIRAQLNLYSELTDSLPDLFWDSKQELGLEACFDQVGRVLDTNIRIKTLNERMDYAQEIASVLRQHLSENHSARLEWIIITLIMIEVGFNIRQEAKEYTKEKKANEKESATF